MSTTFIYKGGRRREMDARCARVLEKLGKGVIETRSLEAEDSTVVETEAASCQAAPERKKRKYKRRDMKAED